MSDVMQDYSDNMILPPRFHGVKRWYHDMEAKFENPYYLYQNVQHTIKMFTLMTKSDKSYLEERLTELEPFVRHYLGDDEFFYQKLKV